MQRNSSECMLAIRDHGFGLEIGKNLYSALTIQRHDRSPWKTRAWTFQEQMLSPRILRLALIRTSTDTSGSQERRFVVSTSMNRPFRRHQPPQAFYPILYNKFRSNRDQDSGLRAQTLISSLGMSIHSQCADRDFGLWSLNEVAPIR